MKRLLTILLLFHGWLAVAQADSVGLKESMARLDKAFVGKDAGELQTLLHKNISFAHSNGWVQHKKDVLNDLNSGKLSYKKIENLKVLILSIDDKKATVQTTTQAEGVMSEKPFQISLSVLQVWVKTKKNGWQLYARQGAKQ
ncbi:MAG TPA: nuclear transport factor 2 family protein [Chitinophagaceae bacterium]|nr:nuclear transport factor 2 family protein [Chitinophagaceae bacterium]